MDLSNDLYIDLSLDSYFKYFHTKLKANPLLYLKYLSLLLPYRNRSVDLTYLFKKFL